MHTEVQGQNPCSLYASLSVPAHFICYMCLLHVNCILEMNIYIDDKMLPSLRETTMQSEILSQDRDGEMSHSGNMC